VIDANVDGNIARWINHSCDPNCEAVVEENDKGKPHKDKVFIEAIRDIEPGEELTYNYGIVLDEPHTAALKKLWGCRCGAKKCTGTMLQPKRRRAAAD
jgi:SET domain-containing protein